MVAVDPSKFSAVPSNKMNILEAYDQDDSEIPMHLRTGIEKDENMREIHYGEDGEASAVEGGLALKKKTWEKVGCLKSIANRWRDSQITLKTWLFLISLGILTAVMGWALDVSFLFLRSGKTWIKNHLPFGAAYPLTIVWGCFWVCMAILCCKKLSVYAKGSGTPEMKTILAGTMLLGPLSLRCFIAKILGLVCGLSSGLSIGKEGPFIHMSCILGYQLTGIPYFSALRRNERLLRQMLAAAVSAGITAAFGAPVGGVLFGIEVTVTYYMVNNMWRSYLCAVVCILVAKIFDWTNEKEDFTETNLAEEKLHHMVWYVALGLLCGLGGALFVHTVSRFQKLINYHLSKVNTFIIGCGVLTVTVLVCFPLPFMSMTDIDVSNDLFSNEELGAPWNTTAMSPFVSLPTFCLLKLIFTAAAVSLPLPCGLYLPMFVMGASFGRFYGEVLRLIIPDSIPAAYSVVAAAAWVGGGTHTVSTAVVVFELTGQLTHMLPVLTGVLIARAVAPAFSIPIYDLLMSIKALPYLAAAKLPLLYDRTASDLLEKDPKYLTTQSTYLDGFEFLMSTTGRATYEEIAVVDPDTLLLVGSTTRRHLVQAIDNYAESALSEMEERSNSPNSGGSVGSDEEDITLEDGGGGLFAGASKAPTKRRRALSTAEEKAQAKSIRESLHNMRHGLTTGVQEFFAPETYQLVSYETVEVKFDTKNELLKTMFNEKMTFVTSLRDNKGTGVKVDPAPMSIPESTPLTKVHFIFTVTHWVVLFVTHKGKFKGVIGKNEIAIESTKSSDSKSQETSEETKH